MAESKPKRSHKLRTVLILLSLFLCAIIGLVNTPKDDGQETPTRVIRAAATRAPTVAKAPTQTPVPTATLTANEAVHAVVAKALGNGNRDVPRLASMVYTPDLVTVNFALKDATSGEWIVKFALMDVAAVGHALVEAGYTNAALSVTGTFSMQDVYGKASEMSVFWIDLSAVTLGKIQWDNFDPDNLPAIADKYDMRPALAE